jgi:hypothetical protein
MHTVHLHTMHSPLTHYALTHCTLKRHTLTPHTLQVLGSLPPSRLLRCDVVCAAWCIDVVCAAWCIDVVCAAWCIGVVCAAWCIGVVCAAWCIDILCAAWCIDTSPPSFLSSFQANFLLRASGSDSSHGSGAGTGGEAAQVRRDTRIRNYPSGTLLLAASL